MPGARGCRSAVAAVCYRGELPALVAGGDAEYSLLPPPFFFKYTAISVTSINKRCLKELCFASDKLNIYGDILLGS